MYNKEKIEKGMSLLMDGIHAMKMEPVSVVCRLDNGDLKVMNFPGAKDPFRSFECACRNFLGIEENNAGNNTNKK